MAYLRRVLPRALFLGLVLSLCIASDIPSSAAESGAGQSTPCNRVRFLPRQGHADAMKGGKFQGSNVGPTNGFVDLAEIKAAPAEGKWAEVRFENKTAYRYLRYYAPPGSWGNVAEVEFYHDDAKLGGKPFGTFGARDDSGNTFAKAFDGDPKTFFDAPLENDQYLGIEIAMQDAAPSTARGAMEKAVGSRRHFHMGNSLTDTEGEFTQAIAKAAGYADDFFDRNTIPGCPIAGLWEHRAEKQGFGTPAVDAAVKDAPLTDLVLQVFWQNGDTANPVPLVGFYDLFKQQSPEVRLWVYGQWPEIGKEKPSEAKPEYWEEQAAALMRVYALAAINAQRQRPHKPPVAVIPGGLALVHLKRAIEAGKVPGWKSFFGEVFADGIHLSSNGRYFIGLVHYACIYGKSPVGLPSVSIHGQETTLTAEQTKILEQIAWDSVVAYRDAPQRYAAVAIPAEIDARDRVGSLPPYTSHADVRYISQGATFDYLVCPPKEGSYQLRISAANGSQEARPLEVSINDAAPQTVQIAPSGRWETFADAAPLAVQLTAGINVVRLRVPDNRPYNLNSLKFSDAAGKGIAHMLPTTTFYAFATEIKAGETYTNLFSVAHGDTPAEKLAVAVEPANDELTSKAGVRIESGDFEDQWKNHYNRRLTITPAAGKTGEDKLLLTVAVPDGASRSISFSVKVK